MNLRAGPPFVIAHRGASGYLPEHTREAKARIVETTIRNIEAFASGSPQNKVI